MRKGLVFRNQVGHCLDWLEAMLTCTGSFLDGSPIQPLVKVFHWGRDDPVVGMTTDACPVGLGGVLHVGGKAVAYFSHQLRESDRDSFRLLSRFLKNRRIRFFVQTDNTSA